MMNPPHRPDPNVDRSGTLIETEEDVRQALLSGLKGQPSFPASPAPHPAPPQPAPPPIQAATQPQPLAAHSASPYRPTSRPPCPLLIVFDDGRLDGEIIRIREPRFVIGRSEGDLRFPLDGRMSGRHAEITHQYVGGLHRWVVTDLQSTHGLFVRVSKTVLADKAEILVGSGRYRFDAPQAESAATTTEYTPDEPNRGVTRGWDDAPSPFRPPAFTELLGNEIGNRTLLVKNEYWIGSDPSCPINRPDDPFCEARHVRLYRKPQGGWHAEHNRTLNGLWLRMSQITVDAMVHFQIGEQRFQIKLP
jgi:pSer/pThr/pTyr-binding forkhead associated (FHA) protein